MIIVPHTTNRQDETEYSSERFSCSCERGDLRKCANCGEEFCACTEGLWSTGEDNITYCCKSCKVEAELEGNE
jgi:hypothetical protein